jgi:hypothetical protein
MTKYVDLCRQMTRIFRCVMALDHTNKDFVSIYVEMSMLSLYKLYTFLYIYYFFFKSILDSKNRHIDIKR